MLVASKESIAKVRGYNSPLLAAAILSMIFYFVGASVYDHLVWESEDDFAKPFNLVNGANTFVPDVDGVYLLVKVIDRYGCARTPKYRELVSAPGFSFKVLDKAGASAPPWYFFVEPYPVPESIDDCNVYAACYLRKGQKLSYEMLYAPGKSHQRFDVRLYRLGTRFGDMLPQPSVRASKLLVAGRILSPGDYVVAFTYPFARHSAKLDLPVPLIEAPVNIKLKQGLLPGEAIKSSMLELPKNEEELRQFLAARNLIVAANQPDLK